MIDVMSFDWMLNIYVGHFTVVLTGKNKVLNALGKISRKLVVNKDRTYFHISIIPLVLVIFLVVKQSQSLPFVILGNHL